MNERQFEGLRLGLTKDAPSEPALLQFGVWTAQFANAFNDARTDLVVVGTRGEIAAGLVGPVGGVEEVRRSVAGKVTLTSSPGGYALLAHARYADTLGRQELGITLRSFDEAPAVSDLLLAKAWVGDTTDRVAMLEHLQRDLTFEPGDTVRVYSELYRLRPSANRVSYRVIYRVVHSEDLQRDIAREEWPGAISLEFNRVANSSTGRAAEVLDLSPAQIPRGSYLLRVQVWDNVAGIQVGRASVAFQVR